MIAGASLVLLLLLLLPTRCCVCLRCALQMMHLLRCKLLHAQLLSLLACCVCML